MARNDQRDTYADGIRDTETSGDDRGEAIHSYHFHRISPYGVIANLIAMPVVSAWIMPVGILGLVTMPLGLDGFCWRLMGGGIEWMVFVALCVTSFPRSAGANCGIRRWSITSVHGRAGRALPL